MSYKHIVEHIKNLNWEQLSPEELQSLMILSAFAATEFAGSLRIALRLHPENHAFQEMAKGELQTNNLMFGDYQKSGDHADFLWHFIEKHSLIEKVPHDVIVSAAKYFSGIHQLSNEMRAASIVSRENELPGIFARILEAKDWSLPGLPEFNYYLREHIRLDSEEGGHAELLAGFTVDEGVVEFYKTRLEMYRSIPSLFSK